MDIKDQTATPIHSDKYVQTQLRDSETSNKSILRKAENLIGTP